MKRFSSKMGRVLTLCICIAMFVCTAASSPSQRSNKILAFEINKANVKAFENNTLLFYRNAENTSSRSDYYGYNVETGEEFRITSLYNGWLLPRTYASMDDKVYFYIGMKDDTVTLVEMDMEKKSCRFLEKGLNIYPLTAYAHALSDKILLYKSSYDKEKQTGAAVLDIFDPKQGRIINAVTKTFQDKNGVRAGEAIHLCASFPEDRSSWRKQQPKGDFVALIEPFDGEKQGQLILCLYLEDGTVVKEYDANVLLPFHQDEGLGYIYDMRYLGNGYFYFESLTRKGWICRMEGDSLTFVGPKKWNAPLLSVELAATKQNVIQRYYVLYGSGKEERLYVFDTQDGQFYSVPVNQADKNSEFLMVQADEQNNLLFLYRQIEEGPQQMGGWSTAPKHYEWTNLEEMLPYATPLDW